MGLDMTLYGIKHLWNNRPIEDGREVVARTLELGYWRKHPNLHGFIVQTFANGEDNCQRIELNVEAMKQIIAATMTKSLPHTEGFFFGQSSPDDDEDTIRIISDAIRWLEASDADDTRYVYYQASW